MNAVPVVDEKELRRMFEENFERLRAENGHSLAADVKETAWQQVCMYWQKLSHIAEKVTDTEVPLNLPNQTTPRGHKFCIEGVVDIVREEDKTTMYDIKTHELDYVRNNIDMYLGQLNVYAHIWQNLCGQRLDETAVIATPLPEKVMEAIRTNNPDAIADACNQWDPVVQIPLQPDLLQKTIDEFGQAVDDIEDNRFCPPDVAGLETRESDRGTFGSRVCRNCDARFSCSSYRAYSKKHKNRSWVKMAGFYDEPLEETEQIDKEEAIVPLAGNVKNEVRDL